MKLIDLKNIVDRTIELSGRNKDLDVKIPNKSEKGVFGGTPTIHVKGVRKGIDWNSKIFFIEPELSINETKKQLFIHGVSGSLPERDRLLKLAQKDSENKVDKQLPLDLQQHNYQNGIIEYLLEFIYGCNDR